MSMLDQIAGQVLGSLGGSEGQPSGGMSPLLQLVMGLVQSSEGGLAGLLGRLSQAGLGEQIASWVGTGENLPVTPAQVGDALERSGLGAMVAQLGVPGDQVAQHLAALLPQVVDGLTPNGRLPESGDELLASLGGLFGKS